MAVAGLTVAAAGACTRKSQTVDEPVAAADGWNLPPPPPAAPGETDRNAAGKNAAGKSAADKGAGGSVHQDLPPPAPPPPLPPDPCKIYPKLSGEPPLYIDGGIMLTRIVMSCVTREGERGYEENTPWIAMGFPCTGGGGRISIKGKTFAYPQMVAFVIGTNCPMMPADPATIRARVLEATGLSQKSTMMAHNPFAVQYWELPSLGEGDTGFSVELRSTSALGVTWRHLREKGDVLPVRLYGRENAWVQGDHIYQVDGEIKVSDRTFELKVTNAKALTAEELNAVKSRCEGLRPRRNCLGAF
jgi:hypothetical protein